MSGKEGMTPASYTQITGSYYQDAAGHFHPYTVPLNTVPINPNPLNPIHSVPPAIAQQLASSSTTNVPQQMDQVGRFIHSLENVRPLDLQQLSAQELMQNPGLMQQLQLMQQQRPIQPNIQQQPMTGYPVQQQLQPQPFIQTALPQNLDQSRKTEVEKQNELLKARLEELQKLEEERKLLKDKQTLDSNPQPPKPDKTVADIQDTNPQYTQEEIDKWDLEQYRKREYLEGKGEGKGDKGRRYAPYKQDIETPWYWSDKGKGKGKGYSKGGKSYTQEPFTRNLSEVDFLQILNQCYRKIVPHFYLDCRPNKIVTDQYIQYSVGRNFQNTILENTKIFFDGPVADIDVHRFE